MMLLALAAALTITADSTQRGHIHLVASGARGVHVVELNYGTEVPVGSGADVTTEWTCVRERRFAAASGEQRSEAVVVTTPSCEERLRLLVPRTVRRGGTLRVTVRDRWRIGRTTARLCVRGRCGDVVLAPGQIEASRLYRARRVGRWRIRLGSVVRTVAVRRGRPRTRVLTTGDSMMLQTSKALAKRLDGVREDIYVGSGLTKPDVVDWAKLPATQVRSFRPAATVITLGMGDLYPLGKAECCGEAWTEEYRRRVRRMMRTYGTVVWLNLPYTRDDRHTAGVEAVNAAVGAAATGLARTRVVDVASLITPDGVYDADLRQADGVHLNAAGARIVARAARAELSELRALPRRAPAP